MSKFSDRRLTAIIILTISVLCFILGCMYPLMQTGIGIGPFTIRQDKIYLFSSFSYFFDKGEMFIGLLLLFFTIVFPIIKYVFLFYTLAGNKMPAHRSIGTALEIINKWSMLDVFIVAVLILNMKFDSDIIISRLESGTTLFAISIVLMMVSSFMASRLRGDSVKTAG